MFERSSHCSPHILGETDAFGACVYLEFVLAAGASFVVVAWRDSSLRVSSVSPSHCGAMYATCRYSVLPRWSPSPLLRFGPVDFSMVLALPWGLRFQSAVSIRLRHCFDLRASPHVLIYLVYHLTFLSCVSCGSPSLVNPHFCASRAHPFGSRSLFSFANGNREEIPRLRRSQHVVFISPPRSFSRRAFCNIAVSGPRQHDCVCGLRIAVIHCGLCRPLIHSHQRKGRERAGFLSILFPRGVDSPFPHFSVSLRPTEVRDHISANTMAEDERDEREGDVGVEDAAADAGMVHIRWRN